LPPLTLCCLSLLLLSGYLALSWDLGELETDHCYLARMEVEVGGILKIYVWRIGGGGKCPPFSLSLSWSGLGTWSKHLSGSVERRTLVGLEYKWGPEGHSILAKKGTEDLVGGMLWGLNNWAQELYFSKSQLWGLNLEYYWG
jgi:hypothetical protein